MYVGNLAYDIEINQYAVIYALQQLFAFLKLSQRKYVDPSNLFNLLVGIHESGIRPGTEQDPTGIKPYILVLT